MTVVTEVEYNFLVVVGNSLELLPRDPRRIKLARWCLLITLLPSCKRWIGDDDDDDDDDDDNDDNNDDAGSGQRNGSTVFAR